MNRRLVMEERPNRLSQNIDNGDGKLRDDNWAKGLFSLKSVVARVVKACIPSPLSMFCDSLLGLSSMTSLLFIYYW